MEAVGKLVAGAAAAGIAVFAGAGALDDDTTRDGSGAIVESGGLGAYVMQIGDCFNDPGAGQVASVEGVPCSQPHDNEVFAEFELASGPWPGEAALAEDAWYRCLGHFERYVGAEYETSSLGFTTFTPVEEGWAEGDRLVTCFAFDYNGRQLSVSVENSGL